MTNFSAHRDDLIKLFSLLIPEIEDDYRATDDPDDDLPGMCVTVSTDDTVTEWNYQTGDNSFTGGAYGLPHWAVVYISRNSEPKDVAGEVADQWADLITQ